MDGAALPDLRVGDIVRITPADYCYGTDPLTMRVTQVGADLARFPALEWLRLRGVELRADGTEDGERDVLVRVAALRQPDQAPYRGPARDAAQASGPLPRAVDARQEP